MRFVLAIILSVLPISAFAAEVELDPKILLELAKAKRLREAKQIPSPVARKTTCGCGVTGDCTCWKSECQCAACGLGSGGAQKQPGKASSGMKDTVVRPVAISPRPDKEPGSFAPSPEDSINTPAPNVYQLGGTSCPNGQCPNASSSRTYILPWRR